MNDRPTPETDQFKVKLKTICGEKYWVPVEHSERLERERDEAREEAGAAWSYDYWENLPAAEYARRQGVQPVNDFSVLFGAGQAEDWEGFEEAVRLASIEAKALATSIQKSEYSDVKFELCDSVAGVISQIDNMYAGVREQRDEAREVLREIAEASGFDNIGNWARNKALEALKTK